MEAIVASTVGTTIEWYDFFLYGTAAALALPVLFFPTTDPFVGQMLAFGTFTVGSSASCRTTGPGAGHAVLYSVQASLIPELFGTRLRYTGASVGYQLAAPVAGGLAPLIAAWLVHASGGQSWPLAVYVIVLALVSLGCVQTLAETSRKDLEAHP